MKKEEVHVDFENSIAPWLGKTAKVIEYHFQEKFNDANLDLTKEQMVVLKKLHYDDGLSQNDLAFLTLRNKSSLTRLLSKMEKKGYIIRQQSNVDKRVNKVFLTQKGRDTFVLVKPVVKEMMAKIEQNITDSEKKLIINMLKRIQSNFGPQVKSL
ncbi:MarR family winged helix-turn-helix transcriptional regulator [Flavivirga jejuensis]|uniref:MarR family transcriptional regulator n=1 Tax=Flavivirga jejuensis TaxID=870487 RepID=A0ABT8WIK4_9FLAO|nr:MarR family transcriptional regulator [Flavivirga jejuensis]MDO5972989.1 MarR family transcriptional regulator [Flavivirga jejuensis]